MKTVLIIDDDWQGHERLMFLLREHGFSVTEDVSESGISTGMNDNRADTGIAFAVKAEKAESDAVNPQPDSLETSSAGDATLRDESYRRVLQALPDAVLVTRAHDDVVLYSNEAFTELTGYGRGEIMGRTALGLVFFLHPELWTEAFRGLEETGELHNLEARLMRKDGRIAYVSMSLRRTEIDELTCNLTTIRENPAGTETGKAVPERQWPPVYELENLLSPDVDIDREEIGRLIDFQALQDLMNSFYKTTHIPMAITDVKGNVQVATGWQDICTRFHRLHPETLAGCRESDIHLSRNINEGEYALYKCRNGMWDMATPIIMNGRHIANLFLGQFLFVDEVPDYDLFRKQARKYGFDEDEYLAALDRVPRWSREIIENVMEFYTKFAKLVSRLSIGNIRLSEALAEQKRVSDELSESEEKFRVMANTSPAAIVLHQGEKFLYVNPATSRIFGYSEPELLEMNFWEWAAEDCREMIRTRGQGRQRGEAVLSQYEHRFVAKGGREGWVIVSAGIIEYRGIPTVIATLLDITELKRAEEHARASLAEKDVLLKEVHHRVKNNLQIISTLLDLQAYAIQDERSHEPFRESQDRIRSMALVHDKLYQAKDFSCIDFAGYIESLTAQLYRSYVSDPERVSHSVETREVYLGVDEAIPCGMIINELVTNALKHAFPDDRQGEIVISFGVDDEGWVTLTVSDNGVGFPPGLNPEKTETLGMQLVHMLTQQLRGRIAIDAEQPGTAVKITFPGCPAP